MASSISSSTAWSTVISPARSRAATAAMGSLAARTLGAADGRHGAGLGRRRLVHSLDGRCFVYGVRRPGAVARTLDTHPLRTITPR